MNGERARRSDTPVAGECCRLLRNHSRAQGVNTRRSADDIPSFLDYLVYELREGLLSFLYLVRLARHSAEQLVRNIKRCGGLCRESRVIDPGCITDCH